VDAGIKELVEKYVPLYELKMHSKIEGIEIGFEQVVTEQKREYKERIYLKAIALREAQEHQIPNEEKLKTLKDKSRLY